MGVGVGLCVFEEDSELAVQTALNLFAIIGQDTGLLLEVETFFSGVDVLLESLNWRDPRWFSDEGCDMTGYWLDFWENLNA